MKVIKIIVNTIILLALPLWILPVFLHGFLSEWKWRRDFCNKWFWE